MRGDSVICTDLGAIWTSNDGQPIEVTVEGGGFTEAERLMLEAELLMGRWPTTLPSGDGSPITVTYCGDHREPLFHWNESA